MNRREFLIQTAAGAAAAPFAHRAFAALAPNVSSATLTVSGRTTHRLPLTYTGLSYELAQLSEPDFFSASNRDLVAYFRLLSRQGVLRLGGNTSEFCWLRAAPSTVAPKLHLPPGNLAANWMPHRLFALSPEAIDNLGGFLDATAWRLIYGVNFGNSTPGRAAAEASYVAAKLGRHLEFFQIGNEPDFYKNPTNGTRPPGWDFADYAAEWMQFADAITAAVPHARFGGPDVGSSSDWITRFASEIAPRLGDRLVALTGHYYAEGPPDDPRVTTSRLLAGDSRILAQMQQVEAVANVHSLVYRMTEGNSCYRGGKPGMSNAFAAALWAGDYMLKLASLGCVGVNLHGGDSRFLSAGLGDHTPGLDASHQPQSMRSGFYTPIATEQGEPIHAMPIYYGMMLAEQFAGATLVESDLKTSANATAYAAAAGEGYRIAVFNKDENQSIELKVSAPHSIRRATAWRLRAPALDSTVGVTLAGSSIEPHAQWKAKDSERPVVEAEHTQVSIPAGSAVLLFTE